MSVRVNANFHLDRPLRVGDSETAQQRLCPLCGPRLRHLSLLQPVTMAMIVPTAISISSHGAVTCVTALELEMSTICIERAARRHCPPEHCSGEKTLLHWPRYSVAPHQSIREFHRKRSGMALEVPNRLPVIHRHRTEACRQDRSRRLGVWQNFCRHCASGFRKRLS